MKSSINYWSIVDEIGWGTKTTDYDKIRENLKKIYTKDILVELDAFIIEKNTKLYNILHTYSYDKLGDLSYFGVSDDGFSDLIYHIIGLGEKEYNKVIKNPELAKKRADKDDFEESFSYCFLFGWN